MKEKNYTLINKEEIHFDSVANTWTLLTADGFTIKESRVGAHLAGGKKIFGRFVQSKKKSFNDPAGSGDCVIAEFVNDEFNLSFIWQLYSYDKGPTRAIALTVTNDASDTVKVEDIFAIDGILFEDWEEKEKCRVLNCSPNMGGFLWYSKILEEVTTGLKSGSQIEAYWSTAINNPSRNINFVIGMGTAPKAFYRYVFSRDNSGIKLYASALQETKNNYPWIGPGGAVTANPKAKTIPIHPLFLGAGRSIECRFSFAHSSSIHDALDNHANYVRDYLKIKLRFNPSSGLWGDYACDPSFRNIDPKHVTSVRLTTNMEILQDKLQPYGLSTIMFTLAVGEANEVAPDDFDWRSTIPDEVLKKIDVSRSDYQGLAEGFKLEEYFPDGVRSFTDEIHKRGFQAGFHFVEFQHIKGGKREWDDAAAKWIKKKYIDEWGFDYLFIGGGSENFQTDITLVEAYRNRIQRIRELVGPDIFISSTHPTQTIGIVDSSRAAQDFRGGMETILLHQMAQRYFYHGKWFQLDPEFIDIAEKPFFWDSKIPLSQKIVTPFEKAKAIVSLYGINCWCFFVGGALERTSDERFHLYSRALPVYPGRAYPLDLMAEKNPLSVWVLPVSQPGSGDHITIALFNWNKDEETSVSFKQDEVVDSEGQFLLFDFWDKRYLGTLHDEYEVSLPPFTCQVVFATEKQEEITLIGTDRHITGAFAIEEYHYDSQKRIISGKSEGPQDTEHSLYFYLNDDTAPLSFDNCTGEMMEIHILRVTVNFDASPEQKWSVALDENAKVAYYEDEYAELKFSPSIVRRERDKNLN